MRYPYRDACAVVRCGGDDGGVAGDDNFIPPSCKRTGVSAERHKMPEPRGRARNEKVR